MKIRFKSQPHQNAAVQAVLDCLRGQPAGTPEPVAPSGRAGQLDLLQAGGFRNAALQLNDAALLDNIRDVQRRQNLPLSAALASTDVCRLNLDIEMETGTGKTYCYIKTIFEMNQRYGWSKFIIVVPSIAIREGVAKSLAITAEHFLESHHKKARFFVYSSRQPHQLEGFSSDAGISVMVINVQAFNATGKDARRIYEEQDEFGSRRPIDVIAATRPVLILDEPQKMEGDKTLGSLRHFAPLMVLRYSATHKTSHNKIYRLDALDAYNQKLVKKIAVRGIAVRGIAGMNGYLYLQSVEVASNKPPSARVEFEQKLKGGAIRRTVRKLERGDDLYEASNGLEQYRGYVVAEVDANADVVSFTNGVQLAAGEAVGDVGEAALRRIQIREAVKAHFDKEQSLYHQGVKVLTLFFIDEVAKYRDYAAEDEKGEYARVFEEEYALYLGELLAREQGAYRDYLEGIEAARTHAGYFSIDRKSRRLVDPEMGRKATEADDALAYDLILKDKERLLSLAEPVRFIFSHSALREGWDNPNVFVICTLKHSDNTVSRRQEVGRGLRLAVNQSGERIDHPAIVHEVNVLTVVASESYKDFVAALQKDIGESLSERPRAADKAYFIGKVLRTADGDVTLDEDLAAAVEFWLIQNGYVDRKRHLTGVYHDARRGGMLAELPDELAAFGAQLFELVDGVLGEGGGVRIDDGRRTRANPLNDNFGKREFRELWERINRKAAYNVRFDPAELQAKAVRALDEHLHVTPLHYTVQRGEQASSVTSDEVKQGESFVLRDSVTQRAGIAARAGASYDLVGKVAEGTMLTRAEVAGILGAVRPEVFARFATNPEHFIAQATRLVNEQKAAVVVEHLAYDPVADRYELDIFTAGQVRADLAGAGDKLRRHIYDFVATESGVERAFVRELDASSEVVVYAKLPRGFLIPTPVGDYNPDWAIAFRDGAVRHVYFVAETKGSMSSLQLRAIEQTKIACARKFFDHINASYAPRNVRYDVVTSYEQLMDLVK